MLEQPVVDFLAQLHETRPNMSQVDVAEMRKEAFDLVAIPIDERTPIGPIWDITAGGVPVRMYTPERDGPYPLLVFFHGGGWVIGSIERSDQFCRRLVKESDCAVASVEYRMAPEYPFPTPLDDAWEATCWLIENAEEVGCDPLRVGVGGASSGANLAAAVSLRARERGGPDIACQFLAYPPTYFPMDRDQFASCLDQDWLFYDKMRWFWDQYLPQGEQTPNYEYASLDAFEDLENLPPALLVLAEHDPLRAEGAAFGKRLKKAGNQVFEQLYSDVVHGFLEFPIPLPQADFAMQNIGVGVHKLLNA